MVYRSFTSSEKVVDDDITNLILGDINDEENFDLSSKVVVVEEEMKTLVFGVGGWVEMEEDLVRVKASLGGMKKKEKKCKEMFI